MYCNVHWLTLSLLHVLLGLPFCPRRNKLKLIHYVHSYVCRKYKQCFFGHCITLRLSFKSFRGRTVIGSSTVCTACVDNDVSDSVIDHHCIPSPSYFIVGRRSAKFCGGSQKTATYSTKYIVCPLDSLHCRNKKAR